jgi:hypothetical protein
MPSIEDPQTLPLLGVIREIDKLAIRRPAARNHLAAKLLELEILREAGEIDADAYAERKAEIRSRLDAVLHRGEETSKQQG